MALDPGVIALARTRSRKCYGRSPRACAEVGWRDGRCGPRVDLDQPVGVAALRRARFVVWETVAGVVAAAA